MSKPQTLIALRLGFFNGRRVRPGESFEFSGKALPKWAAPKDKVKTLPTGKPVLMGDTKPKDAQDAVKAKTAGINEVAGDLA
jgi:hypothetical protein